MNNLLKNVGIWLVIVLVIVTVVKQFDARQTPRDNPSYSEFMDQAKAGKVESATVEGRKIFVEMRLCDGADLLADGEGLFVLLKPGQP